MALEGIVDNISSTEIEGWAFDTEAPGRAVEIAVLVGGNERFRFKADIFREDLKAAGKDEGKHGFRFEFDEEVAPDRVSVRFAGTNRYLNGSPVILPYDPNQLMRPRAENPMLEEIIRKDGISAEKASLLRDFARDGYLKFTIKDPDFDALARSAVDDMDWSKSDGVRVQDAWTENDAVRRIAALPEIIEILELLYGRPPVPFQTLNFQIGTQQETHTDTIHFNSSPPRFMCGVWVALEDVDERNGALHYYPGSHALPVYDLDDLGIVGTVADLDDNYAIYLRLLQQMIESNGLEKKVALMRRGEAIIWAANLYHGGEPIREPGRSRHSQVTHYYFDGCAYYEPLTSNRYLGQLTRPDRRDVRTGAAIAHKFADQLVHDPMAHHPKEGPVEPDMPETPPSLLKRVARKLGGL